jgi:hypothetical protein
MNNNEDKPIQEKNNSNDNYDLSWGYYVTDTTILEVAAQHALAEKNEQCQAKKD